MMEKLRGELRLAVHDPQLDSFSSTMIATHWYHLRELTKKPLLLLSDLFSELALSVDISRFELALGKATVLERTDDSDAEGDTRTTSLADLPPGEHRLNQRSVVVACLQVTDAALALTASLVVANAQRAAMAPNA